MKVKLTIDIYGFKAVVTRSEGWYVGSIKGLGVVDQGKSLKVLEERLKEGAELALESIFKNPQREEMYLSSSVLAKLGLRAHA